MIDALDDLIGLTTLYMILVGGLEHFSPYIGNSNPNWLIFFQRGWNHQPGYDMNDEEFWTYGKLRQLRGVISQINMKWDVEVVH